MNEPPNPEVAVFAAALELPADQSGVYLNQACAGDLELRRQFEALPRVHDDAGNFFDKRASVKIQKRIWIVCHSKLQLQSLD
jgi:hypothetical protein